MELKQYHFSREDFTNVWNEVFGDRSLDVIDCCIEHTITSNFELWYDEFEEYYSKYIPTSVTINWYKGAHLGRTNTCTDPNFTLQDFRKFLIELKKELFHEDIDINTDRPIVFTITRNDTIHYRIYTKDSRIDIQANAGLDDLFEELTGISKELNKQGYTVLFEVD